MIPLILSIASSSIIFVLFKLFDKYEIDTFQAIVFNYFTAFGIGFGLYHNEWNDAALEKTNWMFFSAITAVLFISLFFVMALSSQKNGVASTSVAVKMSMAISLILMIIGYSESIGIIKVIGIALAFVGVYLVSSSSSGRKNSAVWMLVALFIGSGSLDFILNIVQKHVLIDLTPSLYSAISLGLAGILGSIILTINLINGKEQFAIKNVIAGFLLGIPNFFSIYLLLLSYQTTGWKDSTVLAVTNVSVVLLSSSIGFLAFKEESTPRKIIGLVTAILAIVTLYIAN